MINEKWVIYYQAVWWMKNTLIPTGESLARWFFSQKEIFFHSSFGCCCKKTQFKSLYSIFNIVAGCWLVVFSSSAVLPRYYSNTYYVFCNKNSICFRKSLWLRDSRNYNKCWFLRSGKIWKYFLLIGDGSFIFIQLFIMPSLHPMIACRFSSTFRTVWACRLMTKRDNTT